MDPSDILLLVVSLLSIWHCFHITLSIALREMWVSSPVGLLIGKVFSIIAEIRVSYVKLFGIMVRGR